MNQLAASIYLFFIGAAGYAQPVELAPPLLRYQSVFFKEAAVVEMEFLQPGTTIHFSTDNTIPTQKSMVYSGPLKLENDVTTVKAIASGAGFLPSEPVSVTFIKDGVTIQSITKTAGNERYPGSGAGMLSDNKGGVADLNAGTWIGYQTDSVEIVIELGTRQDVRQVLIHCLQDQGRWIFLPQKITAWYYDETANAFRRMAEQANPAAGLVEGASCVPQMVTAQKTVQTKKIKLVLENIKSLPEGHPGKGQPGWLFIDEIKLY